MKLRRMTHVMLGSAMLLWLALSVSPARGDNKFTGSASVGEGGAKKTCKMDGTEDKKLLHDTGADVTIVSRKCATALGLLDKDGKPVGNTGELAVEGTPSKLWCFKDVTVTAKDSDGNECSSKLKVYVSQTAGDYVDDNILGKDWQKAVKSATQAEPPKTVWPGKVTSIKKICIQAIDPATGFLQEVLPDISLTGPDGSSLLDMMFFDDSQFSFVPQSIASQLGPVSGSIDLAAVDPLLFNRLMHAGMDSNQQSVFQTVQINAFDIGFGAINANITLLVNNDANSAFGVLGSDLFRSPIPGEIPVFLQTTDMSVLGGVPEPAPLPLFVAGILALGASVGRRRLLEMLPRQRRVAKD
jgi:hypothetical protein